MSGVRAELSCDPALPFGLGASSPPAAGPDLEPGDAVLLYTDGVIEARTPAGEPRTGRAGERLAPPAH